MTTPGEPLPGFGEVPDPGPYPPYTPPPPYGPVPTGYPPQGYPPPGYGPQGYAPPGYAPQAYPPPGYAPPGPGQQGQPGYYPYPPPGYWTQPLSTNGMAIASMILGILWIYWIGSLLALIFGYVARSQMKRTPQAGGGFAIAGIVLGWVGMASLAVVISIAIAVSTNNNSSIDLWMLSLPGVAR